MLKYVPQSEIGNKIKQGLINDVKHSTIYATNNEGGDLNWWNTLGIFAKCITCNAPASSSTKND